MNQNERYFRALETALQLIAFVREQPDVPEYVLVSNYVFSILSVLADAGESPRIPSGFEPSRN